MVILFPPVVFFPLRIRKWYPSMADQPESPHNQSISVTLKVLQDAAAQGNAKAAYQLGIMYANGDEVELQYSRAVEYISQAAEAGLNEAMSTLAGNAP